jgi:hypothetical protein
MSTTRTAVRSDPRIHDARTGRDGDAQAQCNGRASPTLIAACNSSAATSGLSMMASLTGLYFDESGKLAVA